jgi:hypothetical protein
MEAIEGIRFVQGCDSLSPFLDDEDYYLPGQNKEPETNKTSKRKKQLSIVAVRDNLRAFLDEEHTAGGSGNDWAGRISNDL